MLATIALINRFFPQSRRPLFGTVLPASQEEVKVFTLKPPSNQIEDYQNARISLIQLQAIHAIATRHFQSSPRPPFVNVKKADHPSLPKNKIHLFLDDNCVYAYLKLPAKIKEGGTKEFGKALCLKFSKTSDPQAKQVARLRLVRNFFTRPPDEQHRKLENLKNEVQILNKLSGRPHFTQLLHCQFYQTKRKQSETKISASPEQKERPEITKCIMYQELYDEDDLFDVVDKAQASNYNCAWIKTNETFHRFMEQGLAGLATMEELKIFHRDIKLENFLIKNRNFYFADFDLSSDQEDQFDSKDPKGTRTIFDPERLSKEWNIDYEFEKKSVGAVRRVPRKASLKSDVWSFGQILWTMRHPKLEAHPFYCAIYRYQKPEAVHQVVARKTETLSILDRMDKTPRPTADPIKELVWGLLRPLPDERWSAQQALAHFRTKIESKV